jgi:hypothetical protein
MPKGPDPEGSPFFYRQITVTVYLQLHSDLQLQSSQRHSLAQVQFSQKQIPHSQDFSLWQAHSPNAAALFDVLFILFEFDRAKVQPQTRICFTEKREACI